MSRTNAAVGALFAASLAGSGCGQPEEVRDVAYDQRFGAATTLDVFLPDGGGRGRPAVLFVHGGAWRAGSKDAHTDDARRLAQSGFVTASINYRLAPASLFPAAAKDAACALSFLRARADDWGLDPRRVAIAGYSAGGHLVSLLGVGAELPELAADCAAGPSGAPAAVISGAGPEDLRLRGDSPVLRDFLGGTYDELPDRYALASPITHVAGGKPPFLFVHGASDWFVDLATQTVRMREALAAAGNETHLLALRGSGHIVVPDAAGGEFFGMATETPEAWAAFIDFLHSTVGRP